MSSPVTAPSWPTTALPTSVRTRANESRRELLSVMVSILSWCRATAGCASRRLGLEAQQFVGEVHEFGIGASGRGRSGCRPRAARSRPVRAATASTTSSTVAVRGQPARAREPGDRADAQRVEGVQPRVCCARRGGRDPPWSRWRAPRPAGSRRRAARPGATARRSAPSATSSSMTASGVTHGGVSSAIDRRHLLAQVVDGRGCTRPGSACVPSRLSASAALPLGRDLPVGEHARSARAA